MLQYFVFGKEIKELDIWFRLQNGIALFKLAPERFNLLVLAGMVWQLLAAVAFRGHQLLHQLISRLDLLLDGLTFLRQDFLKFVLRRAILLYDVTQLLVRHDIIVDVELMLKLYLILEDFDHIFSGNGYIFEIVTILRSWSFQIVTSSMLAIHLSTFIIIFVH